MGSEALDCSQMLKRDGCQKAIDEVELKPGYA